MKRFVIALILMTISTLIGFGIGAGWFSERPDRVAQLERNLESHRHRRATEDKYDVRVAGAAADFKAGTYPWTIQGGPLREQQLLDALPLLLKEIDRYPDSVLKSAGIHRIIICGTLVMSQQAEGGLADFASSTLYLSLPDWDANGSTLPRSLDHEIFHFIDQSEHSIGDGDTEWSALNSEGFTYGKSGFAAPPDMASCEMSDRWPGFVTPYSRSAIEEDKAEVFSCMMAAPEAIAERVKTDPIVAKKVQLIRRRCAEFCADLKP